MGKRIQWGKTAAGVLLVGAGVTAFSTLGMAGAGADSGPAYTLKATGVGAKIALGGTTLVGATSSVTGSNTAPPVAKGTGTLTPALVSSQQATATGPSTKQTLAQSCAQPAVPFPAPFSAFVALGLACSSAEAAENTTGMPTATASGEVASLSVNLSSSALPVPVTPGSTLASGLQSVLGQLPTLPTGGLPLGTVLQTVAKALGGNLTSLVSVSLGPTTSHLSVNATTASVTEKSSGAKITLLGGIGAGGGPLLTVTVGTSAASSSLDRATGQVTNTDTGALISVTFNPPTGGAQTFNIAPGQSQTLLAGTPLEIHLAAGSASATPGAGKGSAAATGVSIDALSGLGATGSSGGGVDVVLGTLTTSATGATPAAAPAAATPTTAPPAAVVAATTGATTTTTPAPAAASTAAAPVTGATTVHTGEFWSGALPLVLFGLAMLGGLGLVARHQLSRLIHHVTPFAHPAPQAGGGSAAAGPEHRDLLRIPSGPDSGPAAPSGDH